jgi:hypothetical protein
VGRDLKGRDLCLFKGSFPASVVTSVEFKPLPLCKIWRKGAKGILKKNNSTKLGNELLRSSELHFHAFKNQPLLIKAVYESVSRSK